MCGQDPPPRPNNDFNALKSLTVGLLFCAGIAFSYITLTFFEFPTPNLTNLRKKKIFSGGGGEGAALPIASTG